MTAWSGIADITKEPRSHFRNAICRRLPRHFPRLANRESEQSSTASRQTGVAEQGAPQAASSKSHSCSAQSSGRRGSCQTYGCTRQDRTTPFGVDRIGKMMELFAGIAPRDWEPPMVYFFAGDSLQVRSTVPGSLNPRAPIRSRGTWSRVLFVALTLVFGNLGDIVSAQQNGLGEGAAVVTTFSGTKFDAPSGVHVLDPEGKVARMLDLSNPAYVPTAAFGRMYQNFIQSWRGIQAKCSALRLTRCFRPTST